MAAPEADAVEALRDRANDILGFAFARQFWLEVSAVDTKTGKAVCLANAAPGIPAQPPVNGNCGSGLISSQQDPLPQCDPESVKAAQT